MDKVDESTALIFPLDLHGSLKPCPRTPVLEPLIHNFKNPAWQDFLIKSKLLCIFQKVNLGFCNQIVYFIHNGCRLVYTSENGKFNETACLSISQFWSSIGLLYWMKRTSVIIGSIDKFDPNWLKTKRGVRFVTRYIPISQITKSWRPQCLCAVNHDVLYVAFNLFVAVITINVIKINLKLD